MRDWIAIVVLYISTVLLFRWLGGIASAGEAFRSWGEASSRIRRQRVSSSS
jgi:hypothetical protein